MMQPHWERTAAHMGELPVVLCAADMTELDFNGQDIEGAGPFSFEAQVVDVSSRYLRAYTRSGAAGCHECMDAGTRSRATKTDSVAAYARAYDGSKATN